MSEEEKKKINAELSEDMDTRKRQWCDLPRTYEQFSGVDDTRILGVDGRYGGMALGCQGFTKGSALFAVSVAITFP